MWSSVPWLQRLGRVPAGLEVTGFAPPAVGPSCLLPGVVQLEFHRACPCASSCDAPRFQALLFGPVGMLHLMKIAT